MPEGSCFIIQSISTRSCAYGNLITVATDFIPHKNKSVFNISTQASLLFVLYTFHLDLIKTVCEYNDKQLGSVKGREFLDKQSVNFLKYSHKASSEIEAIGLYALEVAILYFDGVASHRNWGFSLFSSVLRQVPGCYS